LIQDSISGRDLIERGYPGDVDMAVAENVSALAPRLQDGSFIAAP
jgi:phosphosulfolactate phosphohydrolase-like enzyme